MDEALLYRPWVSRTGKGDHGSGPLHGRLWVSRVEKGEPCVRALGE